MIADRVKYAISTGERLAKKRAIRAIAKKVYRQITSDPVRLESDISILTRKDKRAIRRHAERTFGSAAFAPWLYTYTLFRGDFKVGWVPDDFFGQHVLPYFNKSYRGIAGAKTLARRILSADNIPDIAYHVQGLWFGIDGRVIHQENVADYLFGARDYVFLKKDMTSRGRGVLLVSYDEFVNIGIDSSVDMVAQAPVQQASWFTAIHPHSVATIRLTTAFTAKRQAHLKASYMRVGMGNWRFINNEFLRCPVIDEDGSLAPYAANQFWHRVDRHPDTGFVFANKKIPHFHDASQLCLELHARVPQFMFVGWDVAINESGNINLLEWNAIHPGISFSEASTGPHFADMNLANVVRLR